MRITLCGSAKFEGSFHEWNKKLTLKGHTVYGLAVYPSFMEGDKNWYNEKQKITLDLVHFDKICNSDAIVVIDVDQYIGDSTRREIEWARIQGKRVFWITPDLGKTNLNWYRFMDNPDCWAGILV